MTEAASGEQAGKLVADLLKQAPPGELLAVTQDVRGVVGSDAVLDSVAEEAFREHNTANLLAATLPESAAAGEGAALLVCAHAQLDPTHYLDPRRGLVVTIDHLKQVATEARKATDDEASPAAAEEDRKAVEQALDKYVNESYPQGVVEVYAKSVAEGGTGAGVLVACISSAAAKADAFWSGSWRSEWTLSRTAEGVTVSGKIDVGVHYYEEGNVQLNTGASKEVKVADFRAAVDEIQSAEGTFLDQLVEKYENFNNEHFKELRRMLPITAEKFPWCVLVLEVYLCVGVGVGVGVRARLCVCVCVRFDPVFAMSRREKFANEKATIAVMKAGPMPALKN
mmetsp:Transcript_14949/g.49012  ORF Transcript_14949/g.49012 Transcript_14949/m.49012 type:complete len:339 (+) Transcript_14949:35-1051(+)